MRVYLIFPPVSPQFYMPYLSVPALGAYLKYKRPSWQVRMEDQNIALAGKVLEPQNLRRFRTAYVETEKAEQNPVTKKWFRARLEELDKMEAFLRKFDHRFRDPNYVSDPNTKWLVTNELKNIEDCLNEMLMKSVDINPLTHTQTIEWAENYPEGIMTEYFRDEVAGRIMEFNPDLIGFSWIDLGQVVPTLVLLKILRNEFGFKGRTVVGGPYVSLIWDRLPNSPVSGLIDHFADRQGEEPLLRLASSVEAGEAPSDIGKFLAPAGPDIDDLPPPDYSDFPLDKYLHSHLRLALLGSWGCYWGKCSFCNVRSLEQIKYRQRNIEKIVEDMIAVKERFNPHEVRLSDNAISFSTMVKIARELIDRNVGQQWMTNTRFDGNWTEEGIKLIEQSHCKQMLFGLESASENIMQLINKGTSVEGIRRILALLEKTAIWAHFYMIVGYPSESREDWNRTMDFFRDISRRFPKLRFSTHLAGFGLQIQSHMYHEPEKHHIEQIIEPDKKGWSTLCNYKVKQPYSNLLEVPGIYEETDEMMNGIWQDHLRRQRTLGQRIKTRLWLLKRKFK